MKLERDIFNGHVYSIDPHDEPSNEALGIKPYPGWVRTLIWFGLFLAGWFIIIFPIVRWFHA